MVVHAQIGVKATMAGTAINTATAPTLATSANFDMSGGNLVALLVTSEATTGAPTTNFYATFAGQNMTVGVWTNQGAQWAGIFYLLNPATTSGSFVINSDTNTSGFAYSAISLGNVGSVAGKAFAANTLKDNSAVSLTLTTATNGGYALGAAINNGFNSGNPPPSFYAGNKANQTLFGPVLVNGNDGHLHVYGSVAAAATFSDIYTNRTNTGSQRNAYVEMAFEAANVFSNLNWATGSGTWDINTTANWNDSTGANTYKQFSGVGNPVTFEDTYSGTSPITVTLDSTVSPVSVTVNGSKSYTISGLGSITGGAALTKSGNGTLTLSTANGFIGGAAFNGGTTALAVSGALGSSGPISFNGATLQWGSGISDDITTGRTVTINAGGAILDSGANSVSFSGPVGNNGTGSLTKLGSGTITLTGTNRYSGSTIVSQGTLALTGTAYISNSPSIIVSNGATLDVSGASGITLSAPVNQVLSGSGTVSGPVTIRTNTTISPGTNGVMGTLTVNGDATFSGGNYAFDVSTTASDLLMVSGNLTLNSGTIITISAGVLTNGVYKLIQYTGSLASGPGSSGNLVLSGFSQAGKSATLSDATSGEIDLIIADFASDTLTWSGTGPNNNWDLVGTLNWLNTNAAAWGYTNGDAVTFDESGAAQSTVSLQAVVQPASITVSNDTTYTFADGTGNGGAKISGSTGLTKNGAGTVIIQTENNNTGSTVISNGTLQVGSYGAGSIGSGNITNYGSLVFAQGSDHTVNAISGTGSLTQSGSSTLTLAQNNTYSGTTTIRGGTLQIGTGGAAGTIGTNVVIDNATLTFNTTSLTTVPTNISGSGSLRLQTGSAKTLSAVNQYQGSTYIDAGKLTLTAPDLIPDANSVGGSSGALVLDGGATAAGVFDLNGFNETINALNGASGTVAGMITNSSAAVQTNTVTILGSPFGSGTFNGVIAENPAGAKVGLLVLGTTQFRLNGADTFSGGIIVGDAATLNAGASAALGSGGIILSNGTTLLNSGASSLPNAITIPDNSMATISSGNTANGFNGTVTGSASATNQILNGAGAISFNASATKQFQPFNGIVIIPSGSQLRFSSSSLSLNGGDNTIFQVDGTLNTRNGSGSGGVWLGALTGSGSLSYGGSGDGTSTYVIGSKNFDTTFSGTITSSVDPSVPKDERVAIVKVGTGSLTLSGALSYMGSTTISNGILALSGSAELDDSPTINVRGGVLDVTGIGGTLNLGNVTNQTLTGSSGINGNVTALGNYPATILPGGNNSIGTLTISNTLTLAANSATTMELNRTNSVGGTNDMIVASAFSVNGTLTVTNIGPALQGGDTFKLFSAAVSGFTATNLPILAGNLYWTNNLAVDGTITVINPINTNPPAMGFTYSGGLLMLSWPTNAGWILQAQTNSLSTGLTTNWVDVPGSANITSTNVTVNPTAPTVFYRLRLP